MGEDTLLPIRRREESVPLLTDYAPWFVAMGVLLCSSGFFSLAEAALFYLNREQRSRFATGNRAQRLAARLLRDTDRLLTGVLFWNLLINIAFFTVASIVSVELDAAGHAAAAGTVAVGALLALIVGGEMLPKSVAVLWPPTMATLVATPLAAALRVVDPVLPVVRLVNVLSCRVLWPGFQAEPDVRLRDLERAVEWSTSNRALLAHEQAVLQSIVLLAEIRVDELMRPRTGIRLFRPPVHLSDLVPGLPPSGYLLITDPDDEVSAAVPLFRLSVLPEQHLERLAEPVVYVPWCISAAEAFDMLRREQRQVAAVINEFGATIGVLTMDDLLQTVFSPGSSRSERLLQRLSIRQAGPDVWHVTGMTSLRRLSRYFRLVRPKSKSVTVRGIIQAKLQRLPQVGDECSWGPFHFRVLETSDKSHLLVELRLVRSREGAQE